MADTNDRITQIRAEIDALPKPYSQEEQYLYALICDTAGVQPKEGYLANNTTFKSPFWRMQQYWHAFCQATELRLDLPNIPSADTVSLDSLRGEVTDKLLSDGNVTTAYLANNSVTNAKLANNAVTEAKLANGSVTEQKLANGSVTEEKLSPNVEVLLLKSKRVTEAMLADAIVSRLLATNRVTEDMLSADLRAKIAKIK